jgi:ABC-type nitrate/sulfonate/bicarbonate transport system substrate-binding protein
MKATFSRMLRVFAVAAALTGLAAVESGAQTKTKIIVGIGADPSLATTYVAKLGGFFEKNDLDVQFMQGASAAALVPMLIGEQIHATVAAEASGISTHVIDNQIVTVGEVIAFKSFYGLVARNAANLAELKGKRIAVDNASNSQLLWSAIVKKFNLDPKDYKIVQVQPPEMVAALQRGDVDAFISWEPWLTRATSEIPGTKVVQDNDGVMEASTYMLVSRKWAEANPQAAQSYVKAMIEATDFINANPDEAAKLTASHLKMDPKLTQSLMNKLTFKIQLTPATKTRIENVADQLKESGRLKKDFDSAKFFYPDVLKAVDPAKETLK